MKCNQCESLYINGTFTHEYGCPNRKKKYDTEQEIWYNTYKCYVCGYKVREGETCGCLKP